LKLSKTFQNINKKSQVKKAEASNLKVRTSSQKFNPKFYTPNPNKKFASRKDFNYYSSDELQEGAQVLPVAQTQEVPLLERRVHFFGEQEQVPQSDQEHLPKQPANQFGAQEHLFQ
jgi:hypothetical protein